MRIALSGANFNTKHSLVNHINITKFMPTKFRPFRRLIFCNVLEFDSKTDKL